MYLAVGSDLVLASYDNKGFSLLDFDTLSSNQGATVDLATLFGTAAEAAKESFTFKGENHTPTVAITDASGGAGGLLQLTVTISHIHLTTLKAKY